MEKVRILTIAEIIFISVWLFSIYFVLDYTMLNNSPCDLMLYDNPYGFDDIVYMQIENSTSSMYPIITDSVYIFEARDIRPSDIHVCSIISYKSPDLPDVCDENGECREVHVVHRVVGVKLDENGIYYILKGDNNLITDPYRIRFSQITGLIVRLRYPNGKDIMGFITAR